MFIIIDIPFVSELDCCCFYSLSALLLSTGVYFTDKYLI